MFVLSLPIPPQVWLWNGPSRPGDTNTLHFPGHLPFGANRREPTQLAATRFPEQFHVPWPSRPSHPTRARVGGMMHRLEVALH